MRMILVDPLPGLCQAWAEAFSLESTTDGRQPDITGHQDSVEIRSTIFQDIGDADALVGAGNSFGFMDGGVDLAIARAFPGVEQRVRQVIRDRWHGELLVGQAEVVAVADRLADGAGGPGGYRFVVYAPTMRVPLDIAGTDNVYRAMWAALLAVDRENLGCQCGEPDTCPNHIRTLAVPGLGTGAGRMPYHDAAAQMAMAWRNFSAPATQYPKTWMQARHRHYEIVGRTAARSRTN